MKAPVWALLFNTFCAGWTVYVLVSWTPTYFRNVQNVSIADAGMLSAAPWLTMFVMANVGAWCADALIARGMSVTAVRKLMQASGLIVCAILLILMPQASTPGAAVLLLCGALGANALTLSGYAPNHLDIAPRYASILVAIANIFGTLPGIIGVTFTGWIVDVSGSFDMAFMTAALINVAGAIIWLIFATGRRIIE